MKRRIHPAFSKIRGACYFPDMITRANDLTFDEIKKLIIRPNPVVLEVGAHDGTDSLNFLNTFPGVRLFCFEPDPRAIAKWESKVSPHRATLYKTAVSDHIGTATFFQSGGSPRPGVNDWDHSSSLCEPTGHLQHSPWCTFEKKIVVETTTLDEWNKGHAQFGYIDFIWADTQGAENKMLLGAKDVIPKTRYIKLECHRSELYAGQWKESQFCEHLKGWTLMGRFGDDLLFRNEALPYVDAGL